MKTAFLLINVGTPDSYQVKDVQKYLSEFLKDPEIIRLPWVFRKILVDGIIVPQRSPQSALAYEKIWTKSGSPLLALSQEMISGLNLEMRDSSKCFLAMRYGNPSISNTLMEIHQQGFNKLVLVPLYPQYARATTGSSVNKVYSELKKLNIKFSEITIVPSFYNEKFFLDHIVHRVQGLDFKFDHVLLSYHGLPASHIYTESGCQKSHSCCLRGPEEISHCYRAQCLQTTIALQNRLGLNSTNSSMSFQSRLGRAEWLGPYSSQILAELPHRGVKKLLVICPAFVTDCLETLEEISVEGKEIFLENGGTDYYTLPCHNADPEWIQGLATHLNTFVVNSQ